jgi:hypothetical protein
MSHGITTHDHMFSVRRMPWHGLGVALDQYPRSIEQALEKAGLGWKVAHADVLVVKTDERPDDFGTERPTAETGPEAQRTFRLRHTGNLQAKIADARRVLEITIDYQRQFKALADDLASEAVGVDRFERSVLRHLWPIDQDTTPQAHRHRDRTIESVLAIFAGRGGAGDTTGNSPRSKWCAWNAVAEHLDYGRRYTGRTNQIHRSFEETSIKQRALDLILAI